jgi:hypothetical protein
MNKNAGTPPYRGPLGQQSVVEVHAKRLQRRGVIMRNHPNVVNRNVGILETGVVRSDSNQTPAKMKCDVCP